MTKDNFDKKDHTLIQMAVSRKLPVYGKGLKLLQEPHKNYKK